MTHLRCPSPTGVGTKDWIIEKDANGGLRIQYGTTGKPLRRTDIAAAACEGGPDAEMRKRINEKVDKGYAPVNDPNDPELQKAMAKLEKERKAREAEQAMKAMSTVKVTEAPPQWF
jgi:hypothetical protein